MTKGPLLSPFLQGDLDNLCGLYSIVNGIRLALAPKELSKAHSRSLFKKGMQFLEDEECGDIVRIGLDAKSWHRVARHMFDHLDERGLADFKCGKAAFRKLPTEINSAAAMIDSAIGRCIPVAIELKKAWNHYTVVTGIDEEGWVLFDSYGYKRVKRKSLGVAGSGARHELGPRAIFFIPRF